MCGIYAALVGKSYHTNVILNDPLPENEIINLRKCRPTILNQLGVQMMDLLEDELDFDGQQGMTIADFAPVERVLDIQVKIIAVSYTHLTLPTIYSV